MTATPSETHEAALSDERLREANERAQHWHREIEVIGAMLEIGAPDAGEVPRAVQALLTRMADLELLARRTQPSAGEVVAWRWRWGRIGATEWHLSLKKPGPFAEEGYEVEPLYATPPDQSRVEGLEAALKPFAEIAERIAAEHPNWYHDKFQLLVAGEQVVTLAPFIAARQALHGDLS